MIRHTGNDFIRRWRGQDVEAVQAGRRGLKNFGRLRSIQTVPLDLSELDRRRNAAKVELKPVRPVGAPNWVCHAAVPVPMLAPRPVHGCDKDRVVGGHPPNYLLAVRGGAEEVEEAWRRLHLVRQPCQKRVHLSRCVVTIKLSVAKVQHFMVGEPGLHDAADLASHAGGIVGGNANDADSVRKRRLTRGCSTGNENTEKECCQGAQ